jgi:hypothetical protein
MEFLFLHVITIKCFYKKLSWKKTKWRAFSGLEWQRASAWPLCIMTLLQIHHHLMVTFTNSSSHGSYIHIGSGLHKHSEQGQTHFCPFVVHSWCAHHQWAALHTYCHAVWGSGVCLCNNRSLLMSACALVYMRVYPKVSGLATWRKNCKWYSSLPLGAVVSLFCKSVWGVLLP